MQQKIIYIAGFRQHAGKTTTSLGIISSLLKYFKPSEIGYIKPVGQELFTLSDGRKIDKDAKIIQKFCLPDLDMDYVSPVKIASGVTKQYLSSSNRQELTANYIKDIKESIKKMKDKKIIIAEGTGHPGVGSIVGLSNADVCKLLNAEIVYLAGGGLGKSLDMLTTDLSFFSNKQANVKGIIFNKLFPKKLDSMRSLLTEKLLNEMYKDFNYPLEIFAFLPEIKFLNKPSMKLISKKFNNPIYSHKPDHLNWERPCNNLKIITLPNKLLNPENYISPSDIVILNAASVRRLTKILKYNEKLEEKLAGLILTCSSHKTNVPAAKRLLQKYNIPVLYVSEDTATANIIIDNCIANTKIQQYDTHKIKQIINLFDKHFDTEKFMKSFRINL